jgi:tRNA(Ile)-lysidine synthase
MRRALLKLLRDERLLAPGDAVLVAVSGGADSVALLHLLHSVAPEFPLSLHAAHLDHAMRPESTLDAGFVRRLCAKLGVPLTMERIAVPALARQRRCGLEEAARDARREFLLATADRGGCARIALGHHRGDQAETVLHRLLRGAGPTGLAGMRPQSGPFIRPLLAFSRAQILAYLAEQELEFVEDGSNLDPSFTRNRIRHQLLPLLATFNPQIEAQLARLGRRFALEEEYWEAEARRRLEELSTSAVDGLRLDCAGLLALHPALRARLLRLALREVRGDLRGIAEAHVAAVEGLLLGRRPQAETHLPGAWAARRYGELWLRRLRPAPPEPLALAVAGPGVFRLADGGTLRVELLDAPQGEGRLAVEFDAAQVSFPLEVRTPRPGDRFRPDGAPGGRKLKELLIDARVEREARLRLPLLAAGDDILWVIGLRRAAGRQPAPGARVLRFSAELSGNVTLHL